MFVASRCRFLEDLPDRFFVSFHIVLCLQLRVRCPRESFQFDDLGQPLGHIVNGALFWSRVCGLSLQDKLHHVFAGIDVALCLQTARDVCG